MSYIAALRKWNEEMQRHVTIKNRLAQAAYRAAGGGRAFRIHVVAPAEAPPPGSPPHSKAH
jgi:hypothetical protein